MKPLIMRTSLAFNVLVLALCVGVWLGLDQIILAGSLTTAIFLQSLLPTESALRDELTLDELHLSGES